MEKITIFLSWSGSLSKQLASAFRDWLPCFLQMSEPFFSPKDIEKGIPWINKLFDKLNESTIGLFFITKENINSPWMLFEAGAVSKADKIYHTCPIVFDLNPGNVSAPYSSLQITRFNKNEMKDLFSIINKKNEKLKLEEDVFNENFETYWPKLVDKVENIISNYTYPSRIQSRSQEDINLEILSLSRKSVRYLQEITNYKFEPMDTLDSPIPEVNASKVFKKSLKPKK